MSNKAGSKESAPGSENKFWSSSKASGAVQHKTEAFVAREFAGSQKFINSAEMASPAEKVSESDTLEVFGLRKSSCPVACVESVDFVADAAPQKSSVESEPAVDFRRDLALKLAAIDALAANFGEAMPLELKKSWLGMLKAYSAVELGSAVQRVMETYTYKTRPPFAVLKAALEELRGESKLDLERMAISEWAMLLGEISRCGFYRKPELHPTTEYALRVLGGWSAACLWTNSEQNFRRADFIKTWVNAHGRVEEMNLGASGIMALSLLQREKMSAKSIAPPNLPQLTCEINTTNSIG